MTELLNLDELMPPEFVLHSGTTGSDGAVKSQRPVKYNI